ncbi:hypothetical protein PHYSODRAFT_328731 [Phytophthora sojae]|uniref:CCHC-type domain-containing protein n=1 Tax=Phytophthora sojae (strain P6497) TaxID=1094619 RepID=G4ZBM9_PHYSP|nr:hypothetical protein PHYSODRAFT_328731 [Phytophthora sojae]EGZ20643.1 hypothetical protein PHYSODRAFT_328731 [Phytophthora sojae]|eukprot:XP_009523360.1 hypothetical protein PHYSODRAFT_328731 [Phytophthora sojae]
MVRVPGSLGDSGFHRELVEDAQVKNEPGEEASSHIGSTKTLLNKTRSADRQSARRTSVDGIEGDLETDLEDKPQHPPQVPLGTPVDLGANRDSLTKQTKAGSDRYVFGDSPIRLDPGYLDAIADKTQIVRTKLRAPGLDDEDPRPSALDWNCETSCVKILVRPEQIDNPKGPISAPRVTDNKLIAVKNLLGLLKEAGFVAGAFEANDLFDQDLDVIQTAIPTLVDRLRPLVDMIADSPNPKMPDPVSPAPVSSPRVESTGYRSSSPYVSAAEHVSDTSSEPQRMSLGPSGSAMLDARSRSQRQERMRSGHQKQKPKSTDRTTSATGSDESNGRLESYFQAAMTRFLKEQQAMVVTPTPVGDDNVGSRDVEMESAGSPDQHLSHSAPAVVATAASGSTGSSLIQRVRISAMSDLKEFSGKDQDEDRARSDQATDEEKCLIFADLLTGPAKNWYRQLGRSTRNKWSDLLRSFQIQYCGLGVSVAWQHYHSRKRSDESPLEYLYRLNVAALRARLKIKDEDSKARREHVEHVIETLGDPELADQLTLLRLADAEDLEEVLRARERAKSRQKRSAFGSKYRQKVPTSAPAAATKRAVRAVQIASQESGSDTGSEGSDSEGDLRRVYLASADDKSRNAGGDSTKPDRGNQAQINHDSPRSDPRSRSSPDGSERSNHYSYCESRKHTDLDCWRRSSSPHQLLTCEKCGTRGHPADRCLFVCRGCGELHEMGKCPMEEFYNQIRQWFNPVLSLHRSDDFSRSDAEVPLDLQSGETRGYWKQRRPEEWFKQADREVTTEIPEHGRDRSLPRVSEHRRSGKWFRQAKITGKINNEKSILLLDTGAEVSIVDTVFARKVGCYVDTSQSQEYVGIGESVYMTEGRTRIKITLAGSLRTSLRAMSSSGAPAAPPTSVASSLQSSHLPARDEGKFAELVDSASRARGVSNGQEHPVIDLTTSRGFDRESEPASRTSPRRLPSPRDDTTSDAADLGRSDSAGPVSLDSLAALIHAQSEQRRIENADLARLLSFVITRPAPAADREVRRAALEATSVSELLSLLRGQHQSSSQASDVAALRVELESTRTINADLTRRLDSQAAVKADLEERLKTVEEERDRWKAESKKSSPLLTSFRKAMAESEASLKSARKSQDDKVKSALAHAKDLGRQLRERDSEIERLTQLLSARDAEYAHLRDAKATIKHQREVILRQKRVISRMGLLPMHDPHMAAAAAAGLDVPGLSPADLLFNARLCQILAQRFPEVMDIPAGESRRVELTIHPRADGAASARSGPSKRVSRIICRQSCVGRCGFYARVHFCFAPSPQQSATAAGSLRKPKKPLEQPYACPLPGEVGHEDALVQLEKAAQDNDAACDLSLRSSLNLAGLTVDDVNVEAGDEVHSLEEDLSFEFTEVPGSAELPRGPAGPTVSVPPVQLVPYSSSLVQTPSSGVAVVSLPESADLAATPSALSLPASVPFPTRVRWVPPSTSVPSAAVVTSTVGAGGQPGSSAPDPALATTHAVIAPSWTAGVSAAGTINSSAAIPPRVSQSSPGSAAHRLLACTRSRFAYQAQSRRGPSGVASTVVTPMPSTPSVASTRPAVPPSSAGMTSPSGRPLRSTAATARVLNAHCLDLLETPDYLVLRSARRSSFSGSSGSALGLNAPGTSAHPLSVSESSESEADDPGSADELSSADSNASHRASLASALPPPHGKIQSYMAARQSPLVPSSESGDSDSQPSSKKQSGKGKRKRRRKHKLKHKHEHKHKHKLKSKSKSAGSKKSIRSASPDSAKDPRPSKRQRGSTGDSAVGPAEVSAASSSTNNSAGSSGIPSSSAVSQSPISAGPASTLSVPIVTAHDAGAHVLPQLPAALRYSLAQLRTRARQAVGRDARITPQLAQLRDIRFVHYGSRRCWEAILSHQTAKVTVGDASGKGSVPVMLCSLAGIKAFADVYHPDHPAQRLLRLLPKTPIFFSPRVLDDAKRRLTNSVKSVTLMERLAEVFVKIRGEAPNSVCDKEGPTKFFVALFERCHWMVESSVLMELHPAFHTGLPYHVIAEMYDTWVLYKLARKRRGDALRSLMTILPDDLFTAVMKLLGGLAAPEIDAELFFEPSVPLYPLVNLAWIPAGRDWCAEAESIDDSEPWRAWWLTDPATHPYNTCFRTRNLEFMVFAPAGVDPRLVEDAVDEDVDLDEPAPPQISSSAPTPVNRAGIHIFQGCEAGELGWAAGDADPASPLIGSPSVCGPSPTASCLVRRHLGLQLSRAQDRLSGLGYADCGSSG